MPLLYENYHGSKRKFQVETKVYRIDFPDRLGEGTTRASGNVSWDPKKTRITSAALRISGDLVIGGCSILIPAAGTAEFLFNGNWIFGVRVPGTGACIGECHSAFVEEHEVLGYLVNGENFLSVEIRKSWGWPIWIELRNFSVYIIVSYEGIPPEVEIKPPGLGWWPYLKWGIIGLGAIAGVFAVLKAVEITRKPKG